MNLQDLKYLSALAKHRHFGKAAAACFVSQPTLSMQLKKLEEQLGLKLVERNNKSVMLTPIGTLIAERANGILQEVKAIQEISRSAQDPHGGELIFGAIPTIAPYLLPQIIPTLAKSFPKLCLYLLEEQTSQLLKKLKSGELDVAILALPIDDVSLISQTLFEEEFMLAVSLKDDLSRQKNVDLADLKNRSLLLLTEGHCLRDSALEVCKMAGLAQHNFEATSLETLRQMVIAGSGITLIPKMACSAAEGITYLPFNASKPSRLIGIFWRKTHPKQHLLNAVYEVISLT